MALNFRSISLKRIAWTFVSVLALIVLWAGLNYLFVLHDKRLDLTAFKQHTLSSSTLSIIQDFPQDVQITVFYVGIPPKYLEDLLKEYAKNSSGKIKTEIIDPLVEIGYAAQFGQKLSSQEKRAIIQSHKERVDIDFSKEELSEGDLTNALIKVTRKKRVAYFLLGHGEYSINDEGDRGLSTLAQYLLDNNVELKTLLLSAKENVPEDCDVLVVAGPQDKLAKEEEQKIQNYLEHGGDALFLIESVPVTTPDKPLSKREEEKNPSLNTLFKNWGIKIGDDIVVDLSNHISGDVGCPATNNYPPHKEIVADLDYTFYIRPRSITILPDRREELKLAPLVLSAASQSSWAETDRTLTVKYDEVLDIKGPVMMGVVIWDPKTKEKSSDTLIAVFTDADFLSNAFIGQYSNAQLGLNVIKWLTQIHEEIFIDPKKVMGDRLDLTSRQKRAVLVILVTIPVLIVVAGVIAWLKRSLN